MDFDIVSQPSFQKFIQAVCLTLLHSLWQGMIAAVLAGAVLLFTSKQKPAVRYNLLCAVLIVFVGGAGLTFYYQILSGVNVTGNAVTFISGKSNIQLTGNQPIISLAEPDNWLADLTGFCTRNSQVIVGFWMLVFGFKSVQAATGVLYLRKIRRENIYEPLESWKVRFADLSSKLGIRQHIAMLESENVTVPMVIGFFKPVVLIPIGMLANLPSAQVEAILLHELAHIRRRDYLVNLMQIFCENIFFFNPAVLWISHLIREEREHCCDDLAISVMQNKTSFIHALVSFQEYNVAASAFSMTFSKKRNHLLDRVKRIINNNNKPLDAMEKLFVAASLVAVATLSAAVSHVAPDKIKPVGKAKQSVEMIMPITLPEISVVAPVDTLPKKKQTSSSLTIHSANVYTGQEGMSTYDIHMNGKRYEIIRENGKTTALNIDGKKIPENEIASHDEEVQAIINEIKIAHERAEVDRKNAEKSRQQADVYRQQAEQTRIHADEQRVQADKLRAEAENSRHAADQSRLEAEKMRGQADKLRIDADHQREQAEKHRAEAEVARKRAEELRYAAEKDREAYVEKQDGLIDELLGAGIIKGISGLSYKLSQDELIVNGTKQPAAMHQKMKAKYLPEKASEMVYNFKGRTGYTTTGMIYTK